MRFDDRLETVLQIDTALASGRVAMWRQLVDMLAHSGQLLTDANARRGLAALAILRSSTPVAIRAHSAHSVASRCRFAPLATLLANDDPAVAVALFDHIPLDGLDWDYILPGIGPLARSRLRLRSDTPLALRRMLDNFGSTDFALPDLAPVAAHDVNSPDPMDPLDAEEAGDEAEAIGKKGMAMPAFRPLGTSIADLVHRIEAYRNRPAGVAQSPLSRDEGLGGDRARATFSADLDGVIRNVGGLPRGVFVGLSIAQAARPIDTGVDAGVARAFAGRQEIVNGRLLLVDAGPWTGQWLVDASPRFDRHSGRFIGYDGTVSQNSIMADADQSQSTNDNAPMRNRSEGMQQMVHELRSPLNAISGFAQLIEGQFFGPVGQHYREIARTIIEDATYLSNAFEDIDIAARIDNGSHMRVEGQSDIAAMMAMMADPPNGDATGGVIYDGPPADVYVAIDGRELHQLLARFVGLVRAPEGDFSGTVISVVSNPASGRVVVLASGDGIDGDEGRQETATSGALGTGFSWRLVDRMARMHGGTTEVMRGKALLNLPHAIQHDDKVGLEG